jgi:SAM-dependent methyltransferase
LACPACARPLDGLSCTACAKEYETRNGVIDLRRPDASLEPVRAFYTAAPFPGYPPGLDRAGLRARASRSAFARELDRAIAPDAAIVEIGCGTAQMSLFLASADRRVVAADLTRASLELGAAAARRFGLDGRAHFVETDLHAPGLRDGAFDVVYCSGVLHHTPDPARAFARIARLARPGGMLVIGLYNRFGRFLHRLRRGIARLSGMRWIPFDPVLRERDGDRREAWMRDQYLHPLEHVHSLGEVLAWFRRAEIEPLRTWPDSMLGTDEPPPLFEPHIDDWRAERALIQLAWMFKLVGDGGLFVTIGRRADQPP